MNGSGLYNPIPIQIIPTIRTQIIAGIFPVYEYVLFPITIISYCTIQIFKECCTKNKFEL